MMWLIGYMVIAAIVFVLHWVWDQWRMAHWRSARGPASAFMVSILWPGTMPIFGVIYFFVWADESDLWNKRRLWKPAPPAKRCDRKRGYK